MNMILSNFTSLEIIEPEAFYGCSSLTGELSFPSSLTYIGDRAFAETHISGSIYIPDSVQYIGEQAFYKCDQLTGSIYIGDGCTQIGISCFSMCSNMSGSLSIGKGVTIIPDYAFYGLKSLQGSLVLPNQIKSIGNYAFMGCSSFSGILNIPESLEAIGQFAFASCINLSGILILPKSLSYIKNSAFFGCIGFTEIHFQNSLANVENFAFFKIHNKCFQNVPKSFKSNNQQIFTSDNFNGAILPESPLNLNCKYFNFLDKLCLISVLIVCSGFFIIVGRILTQLISIYLNNVKQLYEVFLKIIKYEYAQCKDNNLNNEDNNNLDQQISQSIINKINIYLSEESSYKEYNLTKRQTITALRKAIQQECPEMLSKYKDDIIKHSLNDIVFKEKCKCNFKICSKFNIRCPCNCKKEDDSSDVQSSTLIEAFI